MSGDGDAFSSPSQQACQAQANQSSAQDGLRKTCVCGAGTSSVAAAGSGFQLESTGSTTGDVVNDAAQLWIAANVKNPYAMTFAQSFTQSFLTGLVQGEKQREAIERQLEQQRAEQARLAAEAEQQRLNAIFARLNSELKLGGLGGSLDLKLTGGTGDLALKLGDDSGYGIKGLPGIYTGGPRGGNQDTSNLGLKLGSSESTSFSAAQASEGIPGLPSIYLNLSPQQAPIVAEQVFGLTGPESAVAEDGVIRAARQDPALIQPSDDPIVQYTQEQIKNYDADEAANQAALGNAGKAEGQLQSEQNAIQFAQKQMSANSSAGSGVSAAYQQMLSQASSQEQLAEQAREVFESTSIKLDVQRDMTTLSIAQLAPPGSQGAPPLVAGNSPPPAPQTRPRYNSTLLEPVLSPNARPQILRPAFQTQVTHPVETVQACLARFEPAGQMPSLGELDKKLAGAMNAIGQLAKSQENSSALGEEWRGYVKDAEKDLIDKSVEQLQDEFLGATKDTLEAEQKTLSAEKEALKDPLDASMKEAQQLRWEYQATAGFGNPNPIVNQRFADYKQKAQALLEQDNALMERSETVSEHLEDLENFKGKLESMRRGRDFGEWLLGDAEPCARVADGSLNCESLKQENGISKFLQGDTGTQVELLKQVMDFGLHYSPTIKLLAHGDLMIDTWDATSLTIDLGYDATVFYLANQQMKQMRQTDAGLADARDRMNQRVDRLIHEIDCYQKAGAGVPAQAFGAQP